jgi:dTDP-4-dehydrorhamnose 3,5-epimerase
MHVEETAMSGAKLLTPQRFSDDRGIFTEIFSQAGFASVLGSASFVQDNLSVSTSPGTIRGLHFQIAPMAQGKLVRCLRGAIVDVIVDLRAGSSSWGKHLMVELTPEAGTWLWVPEGFAHGFCTLKPDTEVLYKVTSYYSPEHDRGLAFDDPDLGIAWPVPPSEAILSDRDRRHPRLAGLTAAFRLQPKTEVA